MYGYKAHEKVKMATELHKSPIFGPVQSRRLGVSLGINLMPGDGKICSFDCIYCECGANGERVTRTQRPSREEVTTALEKTLKSRADAGEKLDVITFSGNGEPTMHPDFADIIDDTIRLRNLYFPKAKVSVLSNATMTHQEDVRAALMKVDNNIQKLDTVNEDYIRLVDRPAPNYSVSKIIDNLCLFNGHVIIQTMFMNGKMTLLWSGSKESVEYDVCNTTENFVNPWIEAICRINPEKVMIYTVDRDTPIAGLKKAKPDVLDAIATQVRHAGYECSVSY